LKGVHFLTRDQETLTLKECLPVGASTVFNALTDPERQREWTGTQATGEAATGNEFSLFDKYVIGRYLELQPGRRLLFEWQTASWPKDAPPSIVEITLEEEGQATNIILVQSLISPGDIQSIKKEWANLYWRPLRAYFEKMNQL